METLPYEIKFESNDSNNGDRDVVIMSNSLLPTHTNANGTAFGGQIMAWMDICAGIAAKRHCRTAVVTASMDDLFFRSMAKVWKIFVLYLDHFSWVTYLP